MAEAYGNVNVNYSYCKSVAQLKSAADYILGTKKEQIKEGIQKTRPELKEMSQFFGEQCRERGLTHSVRDTFYNEERTQERKSFAECQMQKHDKLSFKEEIKTYVRLAMNSTEARTLEDVVEMLKKIYLMDIRLKGNTISYALPYHANKAGKAQAVRGSKLGGRFTVAGIRQYMKKKEQKQMEYRRTKQDIEEAKQYFEDYEEWCEEPKKTSGIEDVAEGLGNIESTTIEIKSGVGQTNEEEVSFYKAFDHFQVENNISENDEEVFYGSVFHDFNEQWKGSGFVAPSKTSEISKQEKVDFFKLSLEERAKLLSVPTGDQMAELKEYQKRMGYDEGKMKSMKYKMAVYDAFLKEYEYRKKHYGLKDNVQSRKKELGR